IIAAFIFTPWLTRKFMPPLAVLNRAAQKEHRQSEKLGRFYERIMLGMYRHRKWGNRFLIGVVLAFFASCALIYVKAVHVKMLPFDNKPEFDIVIDLPAGSSLEQTGSLATAIADHVSQWPEVISTQSYIGTAAPFNFNGLVRHYYLRHQPWQAEVQVQLTDKDARHTTSHELADRARHAGLRYAQ
ncbi:MAG: efflux RND transporter permease subunit, partial [Betaproteobacteria bacterium]|nr:efflux RND transporter permease subunit [Betaproteobacteria bacterium]